MRIDSRHLEVLSMKLGPVNHRGNILGISTATYGSWAQPTLSARPRGRKSRHGYKKRRIVQFVRKKDKPGEPRGNRCESTPKSAERVFHVGGIRKNTQPIEKRSISRRERLLQSSSAQTWFFNLDAFIIRGFPL